MVCIYCRGQLSVNNSRPQKRRNQTWRRRPCDSCGAVFTSIEALELSQALLVMPVYVARSRNKAIAGYSHEPQPFDRDRLFLSLHGSLRHRATAISDARGLCDTIAAHIISQAVQGRISSRTIAQTVLNTLRRFDQAAASHYGAFHPTSAAS